MTANASQVTNESSTAALAVANRVMPLIDGALLNSESTFTVESVNPSNGSRISFIPSGCDEDVNRAVVSARLAFDDERWSEAPPSFKKKTLHAWADLVAREGSILDALDAEEMGKPVGEVFANAAFASTLMRFYAESVDKVTGDVYTSDSSSFVAQRRVARGVVGAVTPWNFPTVNAVRKLAPALAAGNCVVLKPSELASRSALHLARLALQAGLPPGVLNVVPGLGHTVGRALALHTDIDMLTFTGSTQVGKLMMRYAGESNLKVVMAECGGKSPQIVFDDGVDLDAVSETVARLLLTNQGQICTAGSRVLVQKSIEAALVERLAARFKNVVIGDARDPQTTFGPLVSAKQSARVMEYIESAHADGAELVVGGHRTLKSSGGFFVQPTIFKSVTSAARIAQEEIFGPVLAVIPFEDEAEAIRIANGTMYGLMAYVWTTKLSTGMRVGKAIRSSVRINATRPIGEGAGNAYSLEPAGQSGVGTESGVAGMESYMRRQLVWINHG
jgi:acyl-CoA reductase-like NAD-dependent aldehyde dehydrogenase